MRFWLIRDVEAETTPARVARADVLLQFAYQSAQMRAQIFQRFFLFRMIGGDEIIVGIEIVVRRFHGIMHCLRLGHRHVELRRRVGLLRMLIQIFTERSHQREQTVIIFRHAQGIDEARRSPEGIVRFAEERLECVLLRETTTCARRQGRTPW